MDDLTGCKVVHIDSRRRVALQVVDLLLPGAAPARRKHIADRILAMCDGKDRRVRITPEQARELIMPHMQCIAKNCPELVFWEPIARSLNIYFDEEE
jgi:hypothetical protein